MRVNNVMWPPFLRPLSSESCKFCNSFSYRYSFHTRILYIYICSKSSSDILSKCSRSQLSIIPRYPSWKFVIMIHSYGEQTLSCKTTSYLCNAVVLFLMGYPPLQKKIVKNVKCMSHGSLSWPNIGQLNVEVPYPIFPPDYPGGIFMPNYR